MPVGFAKSIRCEYAVRWCVMRRAWVLAAGVIDGPDRWVDGVWTGAKGLPIAGKSPGAGAAGTDRRGAGGAGDRTADASGPAVFRRLRAAAAACPMLSICAREDCNWLLTADERPLPPYGSGHASEARRLDIRSSSVRRSSPCWRCATSVKKAITDGGHRRPRSVACLICPVSQCAALTSRATRCRRRLVGPGPRRRFGC